MALARFDNILAIKTDSGRFVGFHAQNLRVAGLDPLVWNALQDPESAPADVRKEVLSWNSEQEPDVVDGQLPAGVRTLYVNVAQICNMRCTYCAAGGDGTYGSKTPQIDLEKTKAQLQMLLGKTGDGETFSISFLGGEPLAYPQTIQAIADNARTLAAPRNIRILFDITTNATLVSREVAQLLAGLKASVKVSIDAPPEINDRTRKMAHGRGSTALTLRGLDRLIDVKSQLRSLSSNSVFGEHHVDVVTTWKFLREFPWDSMRFDYAPNANDAHFSPIYAQAVAETARLAWTLGGEKELRRLSLFDTYFRILDGRKRVLNHCHAGKSALQIDSSGRFHACIWGANDPRDAVGADLELNTEALAKYAASLIDLNDCNQCWARFVCGGGCMWVNQMRTGDKHKKDQEFCNRTRTIIAKGIEYYEQSRYEGR